MNCTASLKNDVCWKSNAKICDQCGNWLCSFHAKQTKHHSHFVCWASSIFEMYKRKKDIPKEMSGVCPRCNDGFDRKKSEQPFLFVVKHDNFKRVCGLCKSELGQGGLK